MPKGFPLRLAGRRLWQPDQTSPGLRFAAGKVIPQCRASPSARLYIPARPPCHNMQASSSYHSHSAPFAKPDHSLRRRAQIFHLGWCQASHPPTCLPKLGIAPTPTLWFLQYRNYADKRPQRHQDSQRKEPLSPQNAKDNQPTTQVKPQQQQSDNPATDADTESIASSVSKYLHLPKMPHRPTKEELLAAANGFWERFRVRFKWMSIRSMRPWNADEWGAFVSWFMLGHLVWILVGTTTFFSLLIFSINTVFAQGKFLLPPT